LIFSKRMNCSECNHPLYLQDVSSCNWVDDVQEFVFVCSSCKKENVVKVKLFDLNGHIRRSYLAIMKDDSTYLNNEQLEKVSKHLEECEYCKSRVNDEYVEEVEEKIRFNEKSMDFFESNGKEINEKIKIETIDRSKFFMFDNEKYIINEQDEFFRNNGCGINVCYYMRQGFCLVGMACIRILNDEVFLHKIWLRSKVQVEKEKVFFEKLKSGEIKLKLDTLGKIFQTIA